MEESLPILKNYGPMKKESSSKEIPKVKTVSIPSRTVSVPATGENAENKNVFLNSGTQDNIINNTESVSKKMASEIVPENPALPT